jgi:putative oxidoreductase
MINLAILILRLCLATVFIGHGLQVAFGLFSGPGIIGFSKILFALGFKHALFWAYLSACTQLISGLFLVCGLFSRLAAFSILVFMVVAVIKVHLSKGFFIQSGGFEYNFVIIGVCLALMLMGSGKFAITPKL